MSEIGITGFGLAGITYPREECMKAIDSRLKDFRRSIESRLNSLHKDVFVLEGANYTLKEENKKLKKRLEECEGML